MGVGIKDLMLSVVESGKSGICRVMKDRYLKIASKQKQELGAEMRGFLHG